MPERVWGRGNPSTEVMGISIVVATLEDSMQMS